MDSKQKLVILGVFVFGIIFCMCMFGFGLSFFESYALTSLIALGVRLTTATFLLVGNS